MKLLLSSLACLALASCAGSGSIPAASKSRYMEMITAGLSMEKGAKAKPFAFSASAVLVNGAPTPAYATFQFDNPADAGKPYVVRTGPPTKNSLGEPLLVAKTPSFARVANNRSYSCSVTLFSDKARTKKIDQLDQEFRVDLDPAMARTLGMADKLD